jgi:hypothetical protein
VAGRVQDEGCETSDGETIRLLKKMSWPHRLSSLAGLRFRGLGGGKLSISVRLGALGACM